MTFKFKKLRVKHLIGKSKKEIFWQIVAASSMSRF